MLEVTETTGIECSETALEILRHIRGLGCHIALDDFGAGFTSWNQLAQLPADYLKLDGSLITALEHDSVSRTIVKSLVEVAALIGKKTVAEFVNSATLLNALRELGVDYAQGYLIGKPGPLEAHTDASAWRRRSPNST